jgi:hypothetical protein
MLDNKNCLQEHEILGHIAATFQISGVRDNVKSVHIPFF